MKVVLLIALLGLASRTPAQYTVAPSNAAYAPIHQMPGAVYLTPVSFCDDCTQAINISFPFPWFGQNLTQLIVSSNGVINMDGNTSSYGGPYALDNGQAGGTPAYGTISRIAVAACDLEPPGGTDIWMLDTGASVIVSYQGVPFFPGPSTGNIEVQAELFATGEVEIRFGSVTNSIPGSGWRHDFATGLSHPVGGTQWFSPATVLPEFNYYGQTSGGIAPQYTGVRFIPSAHPPYGANTPEATLLGNVPAARGPFMPGLGEACVGHPVDFTLASILHPSGYEIGIDIGRPLASHLVTTSGQIVNLRPATARFLNGGHVPTFVPSGLSSWTLTAVVQPPAQPTYTAQMVAPDPTHPDGFRLSQPVRLDVTVPGVQQSGPTSDGDFVQVFLSGPSGCTPGVIPFCGTAFTDVFINDDGRLSFGWPSIRPYPTLTWADNHAAFGCWMNLDPGLGGSIHYTVDSNGITVNYDQVPYYQEPGSGNDLTLGIDVSGTAYIDVSGIAPNPLSTVTVGDAVFLGLSCGYNFTAAGIATDPGPTVFSPGVTGTNVLPTDMIYAFGFVWGPNAGLLPSIANLQTGAGLLTFVPGSQPGDYHWYGQ